MGKDTLTTSPPEGFVLDEAPGLPEGFELDEPASFMPRYIGPPTDPLRARLDGFLSGEQAIDELLPFAIRTPSDKELAARTGSALYYTDRFGVPPEESFDLVTQLGALHYREEMPAATLWGRVKKSYQGGKAQNQAADLSMQAWTQLLRDPEAYEKSREQIDKLMSKISPDYWQEERLFEERMLQESANVLPMSLTSYKRGLVGAVIGGGIGGAIGGGAGIVPGIKWGATIGAAERVAELETGLHLISLMNMKDKYGNRIDPKIAWAVSGGVGLLNGAIEAAQFATLASTLGIGTKVFENAAQRATSRLFAEGTLRQIAARYVAQFGYTLAAEDATELVQEGVSITGDYLAVEINNLMKGTDFKPATGKEIAARLMETAEKSAMAFAPIVGGGMTVGGLTRAIIGEKAEAAGEGLRTAEEMKGEYAPGEKIPPISDLAVEINKANERIREEKGTYTTEELQTIADKALAQKEEQADADLLRQATTRAQEAPGVAQGVETTPEPTVTTPQGEIAAEQTREEYDRSRARLLGLEASFEPQNRIEQGIYYPAENKIWRSPSAPSGIFTHELRHAIMDKAERGWNELRNYDMSMKEANKAQQILGINRIVGYEGLAFRQEMKAEAATRIAEGNQELAAAFPKLAEIIRSNPDKLKANVNLTPYAELTPPGAIAAEKPPWKMTKQEFDAWEQTVTRTAATKLPSGEILVGGSHGDIGAKDARAFQPGAITGWLRGTYFVSTDFINSTSDTRQAFIAQARSEGKKAAEQAPAPEGKAAEKIVRPEYPEGIRLAPVNMEKGKPGYAIEDTGRSYSDGTGFEGVKEWSKAVVYRDNEGRVQGTLSFGVNKDGTLDIAFPVEAFVSPEFRRQGIATRMFTVAKETGYDLDTAKDRLLLSEEGEALQRARGVTTPQGEIATAKSPENALFAVGQAQVVVEQAIKRHGYGGITKAEQHPALVAASEAKQTAMNELYDSLNPKVKIGDTFEWSGQKWVVQNASFDVAKSADTTIKTGFPSTFDFTKIDALRADGKESRSFYSSELDWLKTIDTSKALKTIIAESQVVSPGTQKALPPGAIAAEQAPAKAEGEKAIAQRPYTSDPVMRNANAYALGDKTLAETMKSVKDTNPGETAKYARAAAEWHKTDEGWEPEMAKKYDTLARNIEKKLLAKQAPAPEGKAGRIKKRPYTQILKVLGRAEDRYFEYTRDSEGEIRTDLSVEKTKKLAEQNKQLVQRQYEYDYPDKENMPARAEAELEGLIDDIEYDLAEVIKAQKPDTGKLPGGRQAGGTILFSGEEWAALIRSVNRHIAAGLKTLAEVTAKLVADYGEWIRPYVQQAWDEIHKTVVAAPPEKAVVKPAKKPEITEARAKQHQRIRAIKETKGLTEKRFKELKREVTKFRIVKKTGKVVKAGKAISMARMTQEELDAFEKKVKAARPNLVGGKKVIKLKTEKQIQTLKENLTRKFQMTEEAWKEILEREVQGREPKYIDAKNFITQAEGRSILKRMHNVAAILKNVQPYENAIVKNDEISELVKELDEKITKAKKRDPKSLESMRFYAQQSEIVTGAPIFSVFQALTDAKAENTRTQEAEMKTLEVAVGEDAFAEIANDEKALKRIADYIDAKSKLEDRPKPPADITEEEKKVAQAIEKIFKKREIQSRVGKFFNYYYFDQPIAEQEKYKKEIRKALDIYDTQGEEELVKYLETQEWGIKHSGYNPTESIIRKIHLWDPKPTTVGKSHIQISQAVRYHPQEKNILQRLASYMRQMDTLVNMSPLINAMVQLYQDNADKFSDWNMVEDNIALYMSELKGYNQPRNWIEKWTRRIWAQTAQTLLENSVSIFTWNIVEELAFGTDKSTVFDLRNSPLTAERKAYLETYSQQQRAMLEQFFMVNEKTLFFLRPLNNLARRISLTAHSDIVSRYLAFYGKINQVDRALEAGSTREMMSQAKFKDMSILEQRKALAILAKDGKEAMARYVARVYTDTTHGLYERSQRSPAEMGQGQALANLMLFPRMYTERLVRASARVLGENTDAETRFRAAKLIVSTVLGGSMLGALLAMAMGRDDNPYNPLNIIKWKFGGLYFASVEALNDLYIKTIEVFDGDEKQRKRALNDLPAALTKVPEMYVPFYAHTIRGLEKATGIKYIDRYALRSIREMMDEDYKMRPSAYEFNKDGTINAARYILQGRSVDTEEPKKQPQGFGGGK